MFLKIGFTILLVLSQISCNYESSHKRKLLKSETDFVGGCCILIGTTFCSIGWCSDSPNNCAMCAGQYKSSNEDSKPVEKSEESNLVDSKSETILNEEETEEQKEEQNVEQNEEQTPSTKSETDFVGGCCVLIGTNFCSIGWCSASPNNCAMCAGQYKSSNEDPKPVEKSVESTLVHSKYETNLNEKQNEEQNEEQTPSPKSETDFVGGCCILIGTNFCSIGWCSASPNNCAMCAGQYKSSNEDPKPVEKSVESTLVHSKSETNLNEEKNEEEKEEESEEMPDDESEEIPDEQSEEQTPSPKSETDFVGGCCILIGTNFCSIGWCSASPNNCAMCAGQYKSSNELPNLVE